MEKKGRIKIVWDADTYHKEFMWVCPCGKTQWWRAGEYPIGWGSIYVAGEEAWLCAKCLESYQGSLIR